MDTVSANRAALQWQLKPGEPNSAAVPDFFDSDGLVKKGAVHLDTTEATNNLASRALRCLLGRGYHDGTIELEDLLEGVFNLPEEDVYDDDGDPRDPVALGLIDRMAEADAEYNALLSEAPSDWRIRAVVGWAVGWLASRGHEACCHDTADFAADPEEDGDPDSPTPKRQRAPDGPDSAAEKKARAI